MAGSGHARGVLPIHAVDRRRTALRPERQQNSEREDSAAQAERERVRAFLRLPMSALAEIARLGEQP
jgi:hypothetical protein